MQHSLKIFFARGKARRLYELKGKDFLFEYACSDDSIIGQRAEQLDIKVVRLTRSLLDLEKPSDVEQAIGQLEQMPGADVYVSLTCTYVSPLQHLNVAIHGNEYRKKLKQSRRKTINMLNLAIKFLEVAIKNHGRIAVEWPRSSGLWETQEWIAFMNKHNLKYVHFDGCSLGLKGREQKYMKKPWCIATNDLRIMQQVSRESWARADTRHQCHDFSLLHTIVCWGFVWSIVSTTVFQVYSKCVQIVQCIRDQEFVSLRMASRSTRFTSSAWWSKRFAEQ